MRVHPPYLSLLLSLALLFASLPLRAAEESALLVPVAEGIHRVQVEVWNSETGKWAPYSIAHLDGQAGTVKLRIPAGLLPSQWRVRATTQALVPPEWIDDDSTVHSARVIESSNVSSRGGGIPFAEDTFTASGNDSEVVESDIWKLDGTDLYFFNNLRGLQVFDLLDPATPTQSGSLRYPAKGDQMYQLDADHLLLLAQDQTGSRVELVRLNDGAPYIKESFTGLSGYYVESRLVGDRLYLVTNDSFLATVDGQEEWQSAFRIHGIDFSDPNNPHLLSRLDIPLDRGWGNVVTATNDTLIIAANRYVYENEEGDWWERGWHYQTEVYLVDLDTPDGAPALKAQAPLTGRLTDKFKLRLEGNVLTAITQAQGYRLETIVVEQAPPDGSDDEGFEVETVTRRVWYRNTILENLVLDGSTLTSSGKLELAENETLRATRFYGDRAYIVTFEQIDPLFIIDLADPANPTILGELEIPGWSNYLELLSEDRLFSVGVEDRRVALSLFDVADPENMSLLSRVYIGEEGTYSWSEANYDEKAVSIFPEEGMALIPYQVYNYKDGSYENHTGLQLIEIDSDELTLRGSLLHEDRARRASLMGEDTLVSISNTELITATVEDPNAPQVLADLTLAWNTDHLFRVGDYLLQVDNSKWEYLTYEGSSLQEWTGAPQLVVTPRDQTDVELAVFDLKQGQLNGLTVRGGKLFALYFDRELSDELGQVRPRQYRLEVYDVSDPLNPTHLGMTTVEAEHAQGYYYGYDNFLKSAWLDATTLVWMPGKATSYYYPWCGFTDAMWGARISLDSFWLPSGTNRGQVLVSDITNASAPEFTGSVSVQRDVESSSTVYSEAFLAGGSVYFSESHHWWKRIEVEENKEDAYYNYRYENYYENSLISLSINEDGSLSDPFRAEIPGTLTGVIPLSEGTVLALTHDRETIESTTTPDELEQQTVLYAHLHDGTQLLPIDSYTFAPDKMYNGSLAYTFLDRVIYRAGLQSMTSTDERLIERIHFNEQGSFSALSSLEIESEWHTRIDALDGHLLARSATATRLWTVEGAEAELIGDFGASTMYSPWGWSWSGLGAPLVSSGEGLWMPAGAYGVDHYLLSNSVSSLSRSEGTNTTSWSVLAVSSCVPSTLEADDAVGRMNELRWRFQAEGISVVDISADDLGDYWYESSWYGYFHQRGDSNWVFHMNHGWLWTNGDSGSGAWVYDSEVGWCWVSANAYPFLYSASLKSWIYYIEDSNDPTQRWFYQAQGAPVGEEWFSVPQS